MKTIIIDTNNKIDIKKFKSLPFTLYKDNLFWVPPIPGEIEFAMNRKLHPFYKHSEADFIIVESEKEVLGRIVVLKNQNYCDFHKINTGFFYYYEAISDQSVANALFNAAEEWCKKRGIVELYGPRGLLRSNCIGMLVEGFDVETSTGIIYNHSYYKDQIETLGYQKFSDHFSGYLDQHIDKRMHEIAAKVLARGNFSLQNFRSVAEMEPWIPRMDDIHHRAFAENPGYCPSTPEEFDHLARNILALADPRYMKLIMSHDQIAGFLIAFPNINNGLRRAKGKMYPFGWLWLLLDKKLTRVIDIEAIGLLPEYQGLGGNALLYSEIDKVIDTRHIKRAEVVQVDERNFRSKSDMDTMQVKWNKVHRTYKKVL